MSKLSIIPASAVLDSRLSPRDITVLAALCVYTSRTGWAYPSLGRIGKMLGISRQAVQKSVRVLVDLRYMESRTRVRTDGGQSSNMMRVLHDTEHPEEAMRDDSSVFGDEVPPATPEVAGGATSGVAGGATPEVAGPATPEVAHNVPYNVPMNAPKKRRAQAPISAPSGVSDQVWADYLQHRKAKRAPVTETVVKALTRELVRAAEAGWMPDDALAEAMSAGWAGLKAEWLQNRTAAQGRARPVSSAADRRSEWGQQLDAELAKHLEPQSPQAHDLGVFDASGNRI